jgi:hypothetical protein
MVTNENTFKRVKQVVVALSDIVAVPSKDASKATYKVRQRNLIGIIQLSKGKENNDVGHQFRGENFGKFTGSPDIAKIICRQPSRNIATATKLCGRNIRDFKVTFPCCSVSVSVI